MYQSKERAILYPQSRYLRTGGEYNETVIDNVLSGLLSEIRSSRKSPEYFGKSYLLPNFESLWAKMNEAQANYYYQKAVAVTAKLRVRLQNRFPQLSADESLIASLIRAGFTTTDIAELSSRSERTIENHRLRIRTKLLMPKNNSISEFLKTI